jgi:glycosyltransferase involved in cell wall biosynthesis
VETRARINVNVAMLTTAEQESGSSGNEGHARNLENPAGVLFQANVCSGSGAEENRAVALRLSRNGFVVQLAPRDQLEPCNGLAQSERRELERLTRQRVELAQSALYQVGSPDDWNLDFYGACRIGRTAFAADRLPNGWATRCNEMDEVWVPNRFCEETFAASGVSEEKLRVVHTGVDTQRFRPGLPPLNLSCDRKFRFLSITDLHPRRGTDVLLRAYLEEFNAKEDVALILLVFARPDAQVCPEAELAFFIERELGFKLEDSVEVIVLDGPITPAEFPRLYASADALVTVSRAAACGRSALQALASELPVIATNWGGPLEFLNASNSLLVDSEGLVTTSAEQEPFAGLQWAAPSVEHLRQLLRQVVSDQESTRLRAQQGRRDAVSLWDWDVVLREWISAFRHLVQSEQHLQRWTGESI